MKHTLQLTAPFVVTIDDETPLGALAMGIYAIDPLGVAKNIMASTLLTEEFDNYMAEMNKDGKSVVVTLDKPAFV